MGTKQPRAPLPCKQTVVLNNLSHAPSPQPVSVPNKNLVYIPDSVIVESVSIAPCGLDSSDLPVIVPADSGKNCFLSYAFVH